MSDNWDVTTASKCRIDSILTTFCNTCRDKEYCKKYKRVYKLNQKGEKT